MGQNIDNLIGDLRRLVAQWEPDVGHFESIGEPTFARQIEVWIAEAQKIIAAHENHEVSLERCTSNVSTLKRSSLTEKIKRGDLSTS